jgi:F-box domain
MSTLSRLLSLSPKLLVQIVSYLPFKDIISCEASCRHLSGVVKNSFLLKYLKEAGRTGVYDPIDPGFTVPERLEKLHSWEKSWENLDIPDASTRITFDLDLWSPLIGSLHNGHLIVTDADPVAYAYFDISSLPNALPLRSIERGNTLVKDGALHAFAFADEYDLAVIVST